MLTQKSLKGFFDSGFYKEVSFEDLGAPDWWMEDLEVYKDVNDCLTKAITLFDRFLIKTGLRSVCKSCHLCCTICKAYREIPMLCKNSMCTSYVCGDLLVHLSEYAGLSSETIDKLVHVMHCVGTHYKGGLHWKNPKGNLADIRNTLIRLTPIIRMGISKAKQEGTFNKLRRQPY